MKHWAHLLKGPDGQLSIGRIGHAVGLMTMTWAFIKVTIDHGYVDGMWWAYGAMTGVVFLVNKSVSMAKQTIESVKGVQECREDTK